ncbi:MAG: GGDEF domain-containing protein [Candidatus Omnitrophota bacterium]
MEKQIRYLKEELERARSQLYIFCELAKAMRTTLRLEEITYIILTGLTSHEGLGFNRAVIFFADEENKKLNGFMGLGPMDGEEANQIWRNIEEEKKDLYDLINNYAQLKKNNIKSKFMEFVNSLSFEISQENSLIFKAFYNEEIFYIKKTEKLKTDVLIQKLNLDEFLICSLWLKGKPAGLIVADNYITRKSITEDDKRIFSLFMRQAAGAIENSQNFENALTKAHTDSLTSLWNHGCFQYRLDEELAKAVTSSLSLSIMMIDVDNFKEFNDTRGHIQGDCALKEISGALRENCRKIDILCRYGGDEFSLILPANNKEEAILLGERIRKSLEEKEILKNRFTVSIGIATFPEDASDKTAFIEKADFALYQAKKQGKNQVEA